MNNFSIFKWQMLGSGKAWRAQTTIIKNCLEMRIMNMYLKFYGLSMNEMVTQNVNSKKSVWCNRCLLDAMLLTDQRDVGTYRSQPVGNHLTLGAMGTGIKRRSYSRCGMYDQCEKYNYFKVVFFFDINTKEHASRNKKKKFTIFFFK